MHVSRSTQTGCSSLVAWLRVRVDVFFHAWPNLACVQRLYIYICMIYIYICVALHIMVLRTKILPSDCFSPSANASACQHLRARSHRSLLSHFVTLFMLGTNGVVLNSCEVLFVVCTCWASCSSVHSNAIIH